MTVKESEAKSSFVYDGQEYFNRTNAAKYVGLTNAGFQLRMKKIEERNSIKLPFVTFPISPDAKRETYISGKILDILRKPVCLGKENEWLEKLKQAIREVEVQGE